MVSEEKNRLLEFRRDLIALIADLQRVISKQEDLVCYGQFTEEEAKKNIKKFKEYISYNSDMIALIEKQLERDYNVVLKVSDQ